MNYKNCNGKLIICNHWLEHGVCNPFSYGRFELSNKTYYCMNSEEQKQLFYACIIGPYRKYPIEINSRKITLKLPYLLSMIEACDGLVINTDLDEKVNQLYKSYKAHFPFVKPKDFLLESWADDYYYMNLKKESLDLHKMYPGLF